MAPGKFLLGLVLILIGAVLLLVNMGYTSYAFFAQMLEFWPVILILFGASLVWGRDIPRWVGFIIIVVVVACIIGLALNYTGPIHRHGPFVLEGLYQAGQWPKGGLMKCLAIISFLL
ncbi:MAG: LiaI-LiaF-like domain-containing protein [Bacillota bacterium]|jgi:hypothetical protein